MSVQKIMDVLRLYGTFEQRPQNNLEAFEKLRNFNPNHISEAFLEALNSDNQNLVLFTLSLISDYYRDCTSVLSQVRKMAIGENRLLGGTAISLLTAMRDQDVEVADHCRNVLKSHDQPIKMAAAGYLLLCHGTDDAFAYLEGVAASGEPETIFARMLLSEWQYPIRKATNLDTTSVQKLFTDCSENGLNLNSFLRESGQIETELVATFQGQVIGQIVFSRVKIVANKPLEAVLMLPVFVHPDHRRQQIGYRLVFDGLRQCEMVGKRVVFTYGQANFLMDFAFAPETDIVPEPVVPEWMSTELWERAMEGISGKAILAEQLLESLT